MRHCGWRWLAASSLLIAALPVNGGTRPQYGGTLRVEMRAAPASIDPADRSVPDSFGRKNLTALIFDTLVTLDETGRAQPALAESWQANGGQWRFRIRRNVKFHDGAALTAESVAAALRFANPAWKVMADADSVMIQGEFSEDELLVALALPRNAIAKRDSGTVIGTGPFHIVEWQPGSKLELAEEESCWRGRPFLDAIEIEMGKSYRDQMTALQLGRADLIEVSPEQTRRLSQDGHRIVSSLPVAVVALVFAREPSSPEEKRLRSALALAVDRATIHDVLMQGAGEPAGGVLPTWMSGYGFVFPTAADLPKARQLRGPAATVPTWKLGYGADDPLERVLAERIALNARDARLSIQTTSSASPDVRITFLPLESDAWAALGEISDQMAVPLSKRRGSVEELYAGEQLILGSGRIIPLLHVPASYASRPGLQNWQVRADGTVRLDDAWLESSRP